MTEVVIRLQRPVLMTSEMRAWLSQGVRAERPALALRLERADRGALLLRVELGSESIHAAEQELADLMMDMRLLGLRPTRVSDSSLPGGGDSHHESAATQPTR